MPWFFVTEEFTGSDKILPNKTNGSASADPAVTHNYFIFKKTNTMPNIKVS